MIKKRNKAKYKLWFRCLLALIILFCFLSSIFLFKLGYERSKSNQGKYIYTYDINQNMTYQVHLYDNSFIDEKYLSDKSMYVSDLVKNIILFFDYSFVGNKEIDLDYTYSVTGNLVGEYSQTGEVNNLWSRQYDFVAETKKEITNGLRLNIKEEVNLDFPIFNEEVKNFKNKFGIFITSKLDIVMNILIKGKIEDQEINDNHQMKISIPLGVQAFSIKKDYQESFNKNITKNVDGIYIDKYIYISGTLLIISIILFIFTFKIVFNIVKQTFYNKKLTYILKNYGEVIAEVSNPIKNKGYDVIEVKSIEEMIDLEQELRIPIIFYEKKKNELGEFTLIHNHILYKYTLTDERK